jgi:hypothetical protein
MFDERVILPEQLPVREKERKCTDCCCTIVSSLFALAMFVTACCLWNKGKYDVTSDRFDTNFMVSTSTDGTACTGDQVLYIPDYNDYSVNT